MAGQMSAESAQNEQQQGVLQQKIAEEAAKRGVVVEGEAQAEREFAGATAAVNEFDGNQSAAHRESQQLIDHAQSEVHPPPAHRAPCRCLCRRACVDLLLQLG